MHYVIIGTVILLIILQQVRVFFNTTRRLRRYKNIFPQKVEDDYKVGDNGCIEQKNNVNEIKAQITQLEAEIKDIEGSMSDSTDVSVVNDLIKNKIVEHDKLIEQCRKEENAPKNAVWNNILASINNYLKKNRGSVSDFHLIKDIVDRNTDTEEEAIQTQIPMPLYYGLMGTMAGIIVGVGYLWLSGGLNAILITDTVANTTALTTDAAADTTAANGIVALLGGVALAMICSIVGIVLTTLGSDRLKDTKISVEQRKHKFLSWMQAELLPKLNNDTADVLNKVTANLANFNSTFSVNASKLNVALAQVNNATEGQARILEAVNNLNIKRIATANIEVYDKLKSCTDEIGLIAEQLQSSRAYLQEVRALNAKLDASEQRTQAIEDMALFFKEERANLGAMQSVIGQTLADAQERLKEAVESLKMASTKQIGELVAHTTEQGQKLKAAIDEQDKVLNQKTAEINRLVANLTTVDKMVQQLDASAKKQTQAVEALNQDIKKLATQTATGKVTVEREKMPTWAKVLIIVGGTVVSLYCLLALGMWVLNLLKVI